MHSFGFKVVPADGDGRVPVAVAGQTMVDIQKLLTDIGAMLVRAELGIQGDVPADLISKFDLKIGGTSDSGIGAGADEGNDDITEDAMNVLCSTLDFLGKGVVANWFTDNFSDPLGRREIARGIIQLADHLEGYRLIYGAEGDTRTFGSIDRDRILEEAEKDISKIPATFIGTIYRDPVRTNHWHITNGAEDFEITFADSIERSDIPGFAAAGPVVVSGYACIDSEGKRTAVSNVSSCYPFPDVKFHRIITPERDIRLLNPAIAIPSYDSEKKLWHLACDLIGADSAKPSWDECVRSFHDYFAFLWETYCESDEEFQGEEQEIREYLKSLEPVCRMR